MHQKTSESVAFNHRTLSSTIKCWRRQKNLYHVEMRRCVSPQLHKIWHVFKTLVLYLSVAKLGINTKSMSLYFREQFKCNDDKSVWFLPLLLSWKSKGFVCISIELQNLYIQMRSNHLKDLFAVVLIVFNDLKENSSASRHF